MNFTKILTLLFVILGVVAFFILRQPKEPASSLGSDRQFKIEEAAQIHKIFLAHRNGEEVLLTRKGDKWLFNNTYTARENAMVNLLDAITRLQMKYQPAKAAEAYMVKDLAGQGIKVEIYDRKDKLLKAYYIGGGTTDERGTFAIMEGAEQPYVVHLPGWEGNLRFRYNLKGEDWRDRSVFAEDPEQIQSVSIEYPKQRGQSFRLQRTGNSYTVEPFYETTARKSGAIKERSVQTFLTGFESVIAEDFRNDYEHRDSVLQTIPFAIIRLHRTDQTEKKVELFPILPTPGYDIKSNELLTNGEIERLYANIDDSDFMLMQQRVVSKILWGYGFFW